MTSSLVLLREGRRMHEVEVGIVQVLHYEVDILLDRDVARVRVMGLFC